MTSRVCRLQGAVVGHVGLGLVAKERFVQHLIVDVDLAHLGLHFLLQLLLQRALSILIRLVLPDVCNSGRCNKCWEFPQGLFETTLALQICPALAPVRRDGHCVGIGLEVDEQFGIRRVAIMGLQKTNFSEGVV